MVYIGAIWIGWDLAYPSSLPLLSCSLLSSPVSPSPAQPNPKTKKNPQNNDKTKQRHGCKEFHIHSFPLAL